ncbi:MAG: aldo/keto reductase [Myxococcaceae bacterium]|nr:aldo/keto reductase [Myxococcaceae bacterium]
MFGHCSRRALLESVPLLTLAACTRGLRSDDGGPKGQLARRKLGSTGVDVSIIGLGGWHLGAVSDAETATRMVHRALDHGLDFFDNCWDYHDGESERRLGNALWAKRDRAFVMTKIDGQTKGAATQQLEQSLQRLRTDVIDLVQLHEMIRPEDPARVFAAGGSVEALLDAKKAGKVRFIGFTGHKDPSIHLAVLDAAAKAGVRFDTVQLPLNVLDHHFKSFERTVLPRLKAEGIGVLGMKPLASGAIVQAKVVSAEDCLRYAMSTGADVTITGCDSEELLEQALRVGSSFEPMNEVEMGSMRQRSAQASKDGVLERFKTTKQFDGTVQHPEWLGLQG